MRAGYKVEGKVFNNDNFILIRNYSALNQVTQTGFIFESSLPNVRTKHSIGFWRIKRKETIKAE